MSEAALLDSLYLEMDQQRAAGARDIVVTPGNYGEAFAREKLGLSLARWCTCSNYIGAAIDHAAGAGFRSVLLVGHLGKLIKVSAGCMNTHSKVADARRETLAAHAALAGGDRALVKALFDSPTTDGGGAAEGGRPAGAGDGLHRRGAGRPAQAAGGAGAGHRGHFLLQPVRNFRKDTRRGGPAGPPPGIGG